MDGNLDNLLLMFYAGMPIHSADGFIHLTNDKI